MFNPKEYWENRHKKYEGNLLSVGNLVNRLHSDCEHREQSAKEHLCNTVEYLLNNNSFNKNDTLLDYGCGVARIYERVKSMDASYYGYDLSTKAIEQCKEKHNEGNFYYEIDDIVNLPIKFDFILCNYVLVHIVDDNELIKQLTTLKSKLSKNGKIIVLDQFNKKPDNNPHYKQRSVSELETASKKCDLKIYKNDESNDVLILSHL